jgi:hypothetical protein
VLVEPLPIAVGDLAAHFHAVAEPAPGDLAIDRRAVGRCLFSGDHEPPAG